MLDITKEYPVVAAEVFIYRSVRACFELLEPEKRGRWASRGLQLSQERLQAAILAQLALLTDAESIGYDLDDDSPIVLAALEEHRALLRAQLP